MKKLMRFIAVFLLIAGMGITCIGKDLTASLPSDTKLVAKVDLDLLRGTSIYNSLITKFQQKHQMFQQKLQEKAGISPENIKNIYIAGIKKEHGMIILDGDFDTQAIIDTASLNEKVEEIHRDGCIYAAMLPNRRHPDKKNLGVILDANTIVIGTPSYVDSYLKNYLGDKAVLGNETLNRITSAFSGSDVINAVFLGVPENLVKKKPFLAAVKSATMKLNIDSNINMNVNVNMENGEQAAALEQIFSGMLALRKSVKKPEGLNKPLRDKLLANLKIERTGNDVLVRTSVSEETVNAALNRNSK